MVLALPAKLVISYQGINVLKINIKLQDATYLIITITVFTANKDIISIKENVGHLVK